MTADLTAEALAEHLRDDPEIRCVTASEGDAYLAAARRVLAHLDRVRPSDAQPEGWPLGYAVIRSGLVESVYRVRPYVVDNTLTVVPLYAHPPAVQPTVDREDVLTALAVPEVHHPDHCDCGTTSCDCGDNDCFCDTERCDGINDQADAVLALLASPSPQPEPERCICRVLDEYVRKPLAAEGGTP